MPMLLAGAVRTKERLVQLLAEQWPLSARRLYALLRTREPISYQAVHKALKELAAAGAVEKRGNQYLLSSHWIESLGAFSRRMQSAYAQPGAATLALHKLAFNRHSDFVRFHLELMERLLRHKRSLPVTFHARHVPFPTVISGEGYRRLLAIAPRLRWKILAGTASPLDRWCARYWRKLGVTVRLGVPVATDSLLLVTGDHIVSAYLPAKAKARWDALFASRKVERFDLNAMHEVLESQRFTTTVTVLEDPELARLLHR